MNLLSLSLPDLVGTLIGLTLTLMVASYLLGDNFLFRLAIYIFIGVASGYAAVVAWYNVLWPQMVQPLIFGSLQERLFALGPLVLVALLLFKASPRLSRFGGVPMAYLVGVGAATAIGGAVLGTLIPQTQATISGFDLTSLAPGGQIDWNRTLEVSLMVLGTLATLMYFQFTARLRPGQPPERGPLVEAIAWIGQIFIAITLGALFAGVLLAAVAALVERIHFIVELVYSILPF